MNRVEKFQKLCQSHKIISAFVIIGVVIIAFGSVTDSLDKILEFFKKHTLNESSAFHKESWLPPELPKDCKNVYLIFGGASSEMTLEEINKAHYMIIAGFEPIKWAIRSNRFYVDVDIPFKDKIIKLRGGEMSAELPPKWDMNYNSNALEVVAGNGSPIYQVFYRRPDEVIVNGIFVRGGMAITATTNGIEWFKLPPKLVDADSYERNAPSGFKALFKYPAWQNRGELAQ